MQCANVWKWGFVADTADPSSSRAGVFIGRQTAVSKLPRRPADASPPENQTIDCFTGKPDSDEVRDGR